MNPFKYSQSRRDFTFLVGSAAAVAACGCDGAAAREPAPGDAGSHGPQSSTNAEMSGAGTIPQQALAPIFAIDMYLNGFHFYADELGRQIEAHHYCSHLSEELFQCVIYDGNRRNSRLIGIEYIVSERIFRTLPAEEQALWHSHRYETTSGQLVLPGASETAEHAAIASLVSTYGKTWHTWQVDRHENLPLGIPQLMMGFTQDGQLRPELIERRDRELGVSTAGKLKSRRDLANAAPGPQPQADSWQSGIAPQLSLNKVAFRK